MSHVTKVEPISVGAGECSSPILDGGTLPPERPLTLYLWTCTCGDACGYYLIEQHATSGALAHRLAHTV
jgi:hypothetical protein